MFLVSTLRMHCSVDHATAALSTLLVLQLLSHWCMLCVMPCVLYFQIWFNCQIHCQYEKCYTSVMWTKFIWGGLATGYIVTYVVTPADNSTATATAAHIQCRSKGNSIIWVLLNAALENCFWKVKIVKVCHSIKSKQKTKQKDSNNRIKFKYYYKTWKNQEPI